MHATHSVDILQFVDKCGISVFSVVGSGIDTYQPGLD